MRALVNGLDEMKLTQPFIAACRKFAYFKAAQDHGVQVSNLRHMIGQLRKLRSAIPNEEDFITFGVELLLAAVPTRSSIDEEVTYLLPKRHHEAIEIFTARFGVSTMTDVTDDIDAKNTKKQKLSAEDKFNLRADNITTLLECDDGSTRERVYADEVMSWYAGILGNINQKLVEPDVKANSYKAGIHFGLDGKVAWDPSCKVLVKNASDNKFVYIKFRKLKRP